MNKIMFMSMFFLGAFALHSAVGDVPVGKIEVKNNSKYTVEFKDVNSITKPGVFDNVWYHDWDLGPYAPGTTRTDPTIKTGAEYFIGEIDKAGRGGTKANAYFTFDGKTSPPQAIQMVNKSVFQIKLPTGNVSVKVGEVEFSCQKPNLYSMQEGTERPCRYLSVTIDPAPDGV